MECHTSLRNSLRKRHQSFFTCSSCVQSLRCPTPSTKSCRMCIMTPQNWSDSKSYRGFQICVYRFGIFGLRCSWAAFSQFDAKATKASCPTNSVQIPLKSWRTRSVNSIKYSCSASSYDCSGAWHLGLHHDLNREANVPILDDLRQVGKWCLKRRH